MTHRLTLHPDSVCGAVTAIAVDVVRAGDVLGLRYLVTGRIAAIALPPPAPSRHTDDLWQHTCFEAFLTDTRGGYVELNVSPSTAWAGYRFRGYRTGREIAVLPPPRIEVETGADRLALRVALRLNRGARRRLALSAVIEETDGTKSYWALRHPPGAPDFHHADCFALDLPPPADA
jgi:hypothetical protein